MRDLLLSEDGPSVEAIARAILREPAMAAKLMQVAKSTFFGQRRHVENVGRAVTVLGLALVHGLVLTHSVFQVLEVRQVEGFSHEALWRHSLACGLLARQIAQPFLSHRTRRRPSWPACCTICAGPGQHYPRAGAQVSGAPGQRLCRGRARAVGVTDAAGGHLAEW